MNKKTTTKLYLKWKNVNPALCKTTPHF